METAQTNVTSLVDEGDVPFRAAPHNIEAEQALLGAILVNNDACDKVSSFLNPPAWLVNVLSIPVKSVPAVERDPPFMIRTRMVPTKVEGSTVISDPV